MATMRGSSRQTWKALHLQPKLETIRRIWKDSPNIVSTLRGSYGKGKGPELDQGMLFGARHFCGKFSHKSALVHPCAMSTFRLRRLAQSLRRGVVKVLVWGIFIVNSRINGLF